MIKTKQEMYKLLASNELGNTSPMWTDIDRWQVELKPFNQYTYGIRSMTPGGPCYMNVPRFYVREYWREIKRAGYTPQISCMVDKWRTGVFEVMRTEQGLYVSGVCCCESQQTWRELMKRTTVWQGSAAVALLQYMMNENSYDDLQILLNKYPNHVIELTTLSRCFGTVPHRNSIVWEVRQY